MSMDLVSGTCPYTDTKGPLYYGLHSRNVFAEVNNQALFLLRTLLGSWMTFFLMCPHVAFSPCTQDSGVPSSA